MSKDIVAVGFVGSSCIAEEPKAVSIKGAVSPITLDIASSIPVITLPKADGIRTLNVTEPNVPPNASPASLRLFGNKFNDSSVDRIIIGSIIIDSDIAPAKAE